MSIKPFLGVFKTSDDQIMDIASNQIITADQIKPKMNPFNGVFLDKDGKEHDLRDYIGGGGGGGENPLIAIDKTFSTPAKATGKGAIGVGSSSNASGDLAISLGENSLAMEAGAIAFGESSAALAKNSVALGNGSEAQLENTISVGSSHLKRRIVNVEDPLSNQDVATKGFVLSLLQRTATLVVAFADSPQKSKDGADYICGVNNVADTILQAINNLPSFGGKIILMETNGSVITKSIGFNVNRFVWIEGQGKSTKLIKGFTTGSTVSGMFHSQGYSNTYCKFSDFLIDGNDPGTEADQNNAIRSAIPITCVGMYFENFNQSAIYIDDNMSQTYAKNINITQCSFRNVKNGIRIRNRDYGCVNIVNNSFLLDQGKTLSGGSAISVTQKKGSSIISNNIIDCYSRGIVVNGDNPAELTGSSIITNNSILNIIIKAMDDHGIMVYNAYNYIVSNNQCIASTGQNFSNFHSIIFYDSVANSIMMGNICPNKTPENLGTNNVVVNNITI